MKMRQIPLITSRANEKLKFARRVRDGKEGGWIFVEGVRLSEEALRARITVREAFVSSRAMANPRVREILDSLRSADATEVADSIFDSIADTSEAQGIVLICGRPAATQTEFEGRVRRAGITLLLHEVNNPSNLGAIFRTAEAAGVSGVITTQGSADVFSPKALRAAMGANLRLPIWEKAERAAAFEWARKQGMLITAADISAETSYTSIDWTRPRLLIFGSEAHGLDAETLKLVDEITYIPMENGVESLNLAVSSGILLFEAKRQADAGK